MDLNELQQKINNYITVVSSWVRNVGKLYFSGTPENVTVDMIDDNGNLTTSTLPNVAQFRKTVWDDIGGAIGQMSRTLYVDEVNGDDLNDGSLSSPLKTLHKVVSLTSAGGRSIVYLLSDINISSSSRLNISSGKEFYIRAHETTPNSKINFIIDSGNYCMVVKEKSYFNMQMSIQTINSYDSVNRPAIAVIEGSYMSLMNDYANTLLSGTITNSSLLIGNYSRVVHSWLSEINIAKVDISVDVTYSSIISVNSIFFIFEIATININGSSATNQDAIDLTSGVVSDTNGVPRNIISNIVY